MFRWVCFDWGDTLIDMRGTVEEVEKDEGVLKTLIEFGVKVEPADFGQAYVQAGRELASMRGNVERWRKGFYFHLLCHKLGFPVTQEEAGRMSDFYNEFFIKKLKLMPAAAETLEYLKEKGINIALISNANGERVRHQLTTFNLAHYFSIVIISDELGYDKSDLVPFKHFLQKAVEITPDLKPEECLMVGDRADEDAYAKKVGMQVAIVHRKHRSATTSDVEPDWRVEDLSALKKLINTK